MEQFTLNDYIRAIEGTGRRVRRHGKYVTAKCLSHNESNPSMQVFEDGWAHCHAGCPRFHMSHFFPEFIQFEEKNYKPKMGNMPREIAPVTEERKEEYREYDLYQFWEELPEIPRDHVFKGIPLEVLDNLGWRYCEDTSIGMGKGYFIPYFNNTKTKVPFAQMRHLEGERRFTMLPHAKPTLYGKWNISPKSKLVLVEGTSDGVVLDYAMIPWISAPSASSGRMLGDFANYCRGNDIEIIYGGDNDEAGEELRKSLDKYIAYRIVQPPKKYKDWGDYMEAEGIEAVQSRLLPEIEGPKIPESIKLGMEVFGISGGSQQSL